MVKRLTVIAHLLYQSITAFYFISVININSRFLPQQLSLTPNYLPREGSSPNIQQTHTFYRRTKSISASNAHDLTANIWLSYLVLLKMNHSTQSTCAVLQFTALPWKSSASESMMLRCDETWVGTSPKNLYLLTSFLKVAMLFTKNRDCIQLRLVVVKMDSRLAVEYKHKICPSKLHKPLLQHNCSLQHKSNFFQPMEE